MPAGGSWGAPPVQAGEASIQVNGQWANAGGGIRPGVLGSFATYAFISFAVALYRFEKFERLHRLENLSSGQVVESRDEPLRHASLHLASH